ncbi:MAG TPA: hypothetical protein VJ779_06015 [Acetobacteraceae bacterium]|nr:hypothetical protein [Acetobacteraceae bacterium]
MSSLPSWTFAIRVAAACALVAGGLAAQSGAAYAQGFGTPGFGLPGSAPSFSHEQLDHSVRGQRRPPSALPGAAAKQEPIAPPSRVPTLMSPTEALFDAVNRGDLAGVRDAISRGADLGASNELGLTPLDLSIDLGRSDITFLLLAMRNAGAESGGRQLAQAAPAASPQEAATPRTKPGRRLATRVTVEQAGEPSLPRLYAGNGGEPIPSAGFLGFGGR